MQINLKFIEKNDPPCPDDIILNNEIRIKAFNEVLRSPGITLKELRRRLQINIGTFFLNMMILKNNGLIKIKKNKCYTPCYPLIEYQEQPTEKSFTNRSMKKIFECIKNTTGYTRKEISTRTGLNEIAVHYQLKKLIKANLILEIKDGEHSRYFVLD